MQYQCMNNICMIVTISSNIPRSVEKDPRVYHQFYAATSGVGIQSPIPPVYMS